MAQGPYYNDYGRRSGYNQLAPGRDTETYEEPGRPGRPRKSPIQQAILGPAQTAAEPGGFAGPAAPYVNPTGNTGVAGGKDRGVPEPAQAAAPATKIPDWNQLGQYKGQMGAWSQGDQLSDKFAVPYDQRSERYKMLSKLSYFDPTKGLNFRNEELGMTPIEALNLDGGINGATFSAAGDDKLDARGLSRWENYDGREGIGDIITGFKTGKGTWGAWGPEAGGAPAGMQPGGGSQMSVPSGINALMPAILGTVPSDTQDGQSYADKLRQMVMQALQVSPELSALGQQFR